MFAPRLADLLKQYGNLSARLEVVFNVLSHGDEDEQLVRSWATQSLYEAVFDPDLLHNVDDGKALVDIALLYFIPPFFHEK